MNLPFERFHGSETNQPATPSLDGPLLAIETCGKSATVALEWPDGRMAIAETSLTVGSARTLAPCISSILEGNDLLAKELVAIAVTVGPGSFTGLRVGVATAKAMAYALNIPVIAVDSLETMAWKAADTFTSEPLLAGNSDPDHLDTFFVWAVLDAYRGELFAALWQLQVKEKRIAFEAIVPSRIVECGAWSDSLLTDNSTSRAFYNQPKPSIERRVLLVGPGLMRCKNLLDMAPRFDLLTLPTLSPHASMVAKIGRQKLVRGEILDAFHLMPVYLRGSAAEEKRASN